MGSFANTLFRIMLSWLRSAVSAIWSAFTSEKGGSFLEWIGKNWIIIAGILCAAGLIIDLCVYILRWKPFRVWRSFFRRGNTDAPDETENQPEEPESAIRKPAAPSGNDRKAGVYPVTVKSEQDAYEPDLSRWDPPQQASAEPEEKASYVPATVTNAGYVVPADSPYRRPEEKTVQRQNTEVSGNERDPDSRETFNLHSRRRKRISVGSLFSNPEEELYEFDAPQHLIDSRKAYHEPVYPRGWKKNEENGDGSTPSGIPLSGADR